MHFSIEASCKVGDEVGCSYARIDQSEGNIVGSKLLTTEERNGVQRVLCGGVGTNGIRPVSLWWNLSRAGTDIDNHTSALRSHTWNNLLHRHKHADDI